MLLEPGMVRTSFYDAAERVLPGRAGRHAAAAVEEMVGSQSGVAHAIIEAALSDAPPRRLLLNSDAFQLVTGARHRRGHRPTTSKAGAA